jgi:GTPase SAR1 family protein
MAVLFPKYSTNLVVGVSNSGKSYLIQHFLSNTEQYFEQIPENIYIVHCNNRTPEYNLPSLEDIIKVHQIDIEQFDLNLVEPDSILVFEDVNKLHETIKVACNVATHHLPLLSLFIVSQGVTGNSHFELVKIVHRLIFCLGSITASKAADFIINFFYSDVELKTYLKKVLKFAEKTGKHFLLNLNSIASRPSPFLAFTHLLNDSCFHLAYTNKVLIPPTTSFRKYLIKSNYIMKFDELKPEVVGTDTPENTHVVLLLKWVQEQVEAKNPNNLCIGPDKHVKVLKLINDLIEQNMEIKKWKACKSLAQSVVDCGRFCITQDGKFIAIKGDYETRVNLLDFLNEITRRNHPKERPKPEWKIYKLFMEPLRDKGIFENSIKNLYFKKRK